MGHHSSGQQCLNPSPHTQQVSIHHTHLRRSPAPAPSFLRRPQRARTYSPYHPLPPARCPAPCPGLLLLPRPPSCPGAMLTLAGRPRATLSRVGRGGERGLQCSSRRAAPRRAAPHRAAASRPSPPPVAPPPVTCSGPAAAAPHSNRAPPQRAVPGRSCGEAGRAAGRVGSGAGGMVPPGKRSGVGAAGDLAALAELDEASLLDALRDRFLRQQVYVSAGAGLGSPLPGSPLPGSPLPGSPLPGSPPLGSPLTALPSPPPDRRGGHPHRREPLPAPAALWERGECRAGAAQAAASAGAASPSPSSRAVSPFRSPSSTAAMRRARCLRTSSPWPTVLTTPCWVAAAPGRRASASSSGEERARPRGHGVLPIRPSPIHASGGSKPSFVGCTSLAAFQRD